MRMTRVHMFGPPSQGSPLDVVLPDPDRSPSEPDVAAHARSTDADETVLVTSCAGRAFGTRIFNAHGETSFGTHSLAGVAASLVRAGLLPPGEVKRTSAAGEQRLWTDGFQVQVPFEGPVFDQQVDLDPALLGPYGSRASSVGVGRGFTVLQLDRDQDPLALPAPDFGRMNELGITDLTLFGWNPELNRIRARVFAPGFGISEDAGCLPAAAALGVAALRSALVPNHTPVRITQVSARGTTSDFDCTGAIDGGRVSLEITGWVWVRGENGRDLDTNLTNF